MKKTDINSYVNYGCGLCAPKQWINFDVSPTLRIQKIPILRSLFKQKITFPKNVLYGDIINGLPFKANTVDGAFCSHTLEHLSLEDFRIALKNTYKILKKDGIFRCIVPDLQCYAETYINELNNGIPHASINFINNTLLGVKKRPRGINSFLRSFFGNSHHLWMWDKHSLKYELEKIGFQKIRVCKFNDCEDLMFKYVEDESRFVNAIAIECKK